MNVSVKLFAGLTKSVSDAVLAQYPDSIRAGTPILVELPHGSTLKDLVDRLGLPQDSVKVTFVNGIARKLDYTLEPDDEVGIFPPVGGG